MNYPELRAAIARAGVTNRSLSESLGISDQALYNKMRGTAEFKSSEIKKIAGVLGLSLTAVNDIFLTQQ